MASKQVPHYSMLNVSLLLASRSKVPNISIIWPKGEVNKGIKVGWNGILGAVCRPPKPCQAKPCQAPLPSPSHSLPIVPRMALKGAEMRREKNLVSLLPYRLC